MTEDCFFNPEGCETGPDAPTQGPPEEQMGREDDGMQSDDDDWEMGYPITQDYRAAQRAFLMWALTGTVWSGIDLFMWKWQTIVEGTDSEGETEDRVYHFNSEYSLMAEEGATYPIWRWASQLMTWTTFIFMSVGSVTQMLTMFGMATSFTMLWWSFMGMWWGFTLMGVNALYAIAYWNAQKVMQEEAAEDSAITSAKGIAAATMASTMQSDMLWGAYEETAMMILFITNMEAWVRGMWDEWDGSEEWGDEGKDEGRKEDDGPPPKGGPENLIRMIYAP